MRVVIESPVSNALTVYISLIIPTSLDENTYLERSTSSSFAIAGGVSRRRARRTVGDFDDDASVGRSFGQGDRSFGAS